jgi:hypothetical protein
MMGVSRNITTDMTTKTIASSPDSTTASNAPKRRKSSAKAKSKNTSKTIDKASDKKVLSRKEKLESIKKANQALLKAIALMSPHNDSITK